MSGKRQRRGILLRMKQGDMFHVEHAGLADHPEFQAEKRRLALRQKRARKERRRRELIDACMEKLYSSANAPKGDASRVLTDGKSYSRSVSEAGVDLRLDRTPGKTAKRRIR